MVTEAKKEGVAELNQAFSEAKIALMANFSGITVEEVDAFRRKLRGSSAKLKVVKNTLARRAVDGTKYEVARDLFKGPVTVALGYSEDISAAAKTFIEFAKDKDDRMKILGGVVEGSLVGPDGVKKLADLPPKPVVQAMLLGVFQAPARNFLGVMEGAARKFLYAVNAIAEKKKEQA